MATLRVYDRMVTDPGFPAAGSPTKHLIKSETLEQSRLSWHLIYQMDFPLAGVSGLFLFFPAGE